MNKTNTIINIFNKINMFPYFYQTFQNINEIYKRQLLESIEDLEFNELQKANIDIKECERTMLYTFILTTRFKISFKEYYILLFIAAYYKKIDIISGHHFFCSTKISKITNALTDAINENDYDLFRYFNKYQLEECGIKQDHFVLLVKILKDAITLERTFQNVNIDTNNLILDESQSLILLAEEVNEAYRIFNNFKNEPQIKFIEECGDVIYPSIFAFPKLISMLNEGIRKKDFQNQNAFNGYIKVVPISVLNKKKEYLNILFNKSILIYCENVKYQKAMNVEANNVNDAIVYSSISPTSINKILLSKQVIDNDLANLTYIELTLNSDEYISIVKDYIDTYQASEGDKMILDNLTMTFASLIKKYYEKVKCSDIEAVEKLEEAIDNINLLINKMLGLLIKKYYINILSCQKNLIITPRRIIEMVLQKSATQYSLKENEEYIEYYLTKENIVEISDPVCLRKE